MKAVFNTSPLVFLSKLDLLEEAVKIFDESYIPKDVKKEILEKEDKTKHVILKLIESNIIKEIDLRNKNLFNSLNKKLGKGESAVIVVLLENFYDSGIAILDDYVARREAINLGLRVKGTLGILKKLYSIGRINKDLDELFNELKMA